MRILVIDPCGNALDWILHCQEEGHKVKWAVANTERNKFIGRGLTDRVDDPREWMKWAELIFHTDNTKWLHEVDRWRRAGWPVIGTTVEGAEWELNRGIGMRVMKKAGIAVPGYKIFGDYDQAINFVKRTMKRYVSKPSGDADKALSYCAKSPQDMVFMLERWKRLGRIRTEFVIQEFIPGIEMAVGGWFGPGGFNQGWCENWEFKKLMDGDMGVATGEQGTVVRYTRKSKLADIVLKPLEDQLDAIGHTGYIDVNCIIAEDGTPHPLEFTMRPGWPTFNIQQTLHTGDHALWLLDLAEGRDAKMVNMKETAVGVVMSIPDYPYSHLTRKETAGIPVYGMKPSTHPFIHPCEMMLVENVPIQVDGKISRGSLMGTAGDYVLVGSGISPTVSGAKRRAYSILKTLELPNSPMYRTDIGDRLREQLPLLQKMGYATGMTF